MALTWQHVDATTDFGGVHQNAETHVDSYQSFYTGIAKDAIAKLADEIQAIEDIDWSAQGYGAEAAELVNFGINYNTPAGVPQWDYSFNMDKFNVEQPVLTPIDASINATKPEAFNDSPIPINIPEPVEKLDATIPDNAPIIRDVIIPPVPEMGDIPEPLIKAINIPSMVPIEYPEFNAQAPSLSNIAVPQNSFSWSEEDYDSAILQATQARVAEFLAGGVGIPDYVWEAIWNAGSEREDANAQQAVTEITEQSASMGFDEPTGQQNARIDAALLSAQKAKNAYSRELVIQQAQHEIENLKYAVAQGQALEAMIGGWYQQRMTRALDAAKYGVQANIEIFNAQIGLFNAQLQLYGTHIQLYQTELQTEQFKLEEYKTRLESAKILGELNIQEVQIYSARIEAFATTVSAFESTIKALSLGIEVDKTRMEAYKTEVSAFAELVRAKTAEYQGYKAQWDGEIAKTNVFESQVKSYATKMDGYKTEVDAISTEKDILLKINDEEFKKFASALEGYNTNVASNVQELEAKSKEFTSQLASYNQLTDNEKARVSSLIESNKISIDYAGQATQAAISSANNLTSASTAEAGLVKNGSEIMQRAYSQLAASAMSVVSVSAGYSDSTSNSSSMRTSLSFSG